MICSPWNTLHMSNTCQESIETSSMKTWRPTVLWPKVKSHTKVPYLSSLGLMCTIGQRERQRRESIEETCWRRCNTWGKLMMLRRRMHSRQTKRTTPAGDISKVGRVLEQKYINYNFDKKLRQRTFKLKEALLGRSEPDYLWTRKDWLTRRGESLTNSKWRVKI